MKCQSCGKKEATVRYKENINGSKQEIYLCSNCAKNMGFINFTSIFSPMFISIPDFIEQEDKLMCKNCGYTLDDYAKTGLFGCEKCYETFEDTLDELFLKLHGKNRHIKINKKSTMSSKEDKNLEIEELKEKIQELIKEEKYEEAAVIRDRIKELEGK